MISGGGNCIWKPGCWVGWLVNAVSKSALPVSLSSGSLILRFIPFTERAAIGGFLGWATCGKLSCPLGTYQGDPVCALSITQADAWASTALEINAASSAWPCSQVGTTAYNWLASSWLEIQPEPPVPRGLPLHSLTFAVCWEWTTLR